MQNDDMKPSSAPEDQKQKDIKTFVPKGEIPVRTDAEEEYLLRAVDAFKKRLCVISPDFKILASNREADMAVGSDIVGHYCYKVFYDRSIPCKTVQ